MTEKPLPVWTYWEGPKPDHIDICIKSMQKVFGGRLIEVTDENLPEYLNLNLLNPNWLNIEKPAIKSACLRVALIYQNGGWWFDADTIGIKEPPPYIRTFSCTRWKRDRVPNGYFGAPLKHPTTKFWLDCINEYLTTKCTSKKQPRWGELGEALVTAAATIRPSARFPLRMWIPFNFSQDPEGFLRPGRARDYIRKETVGFALNNSWLVENARKELSMSVEVQRSSNLLLHSVLNLGRGIIGKWNR